MATQSLCGDAFIMGSGEPDPETSVGKCPALGKLRNLDSSKSDRLSASVIADDIRRKMNVSSCGQHRWSVMP